MSFVHPGALYSTVVGIWHICSAILSFRFRVQTEVYLSLDDIDYFVCQLAPFIYLIPWRRLSTVSSTMYRLVCRPQNLNRSAVINQPCYMSLLYLLRFSERTWYCISILQLKYLFCVPGMLQLVQWTCFRSTAPLTASRGLHQNSRTLVYDLPVNLCQCPWRSISNITCCTRLDRTDKILLCAWWSDFRSRSSSHSSNMVYNSLAAKYFMADFTFLEIKCSSLRR